MNNRGLVVGVLVAVAVALLPLAITREDIINRLVVTFILATLAVSWNILSGYAGQVNLGHAAFFGIGNLIARLLWLQGIPLIVGFPLGGLGATVFALLIGVPALRLRGIYFAIGTLAMAEALRLTVNNVLPGVSFLPVEQLSSYDITPRYYVALGLLLVTVISSYMLSRSRLGLGMMTVRENEDAAQAIGVNATWHKLVALALSALFAGLAGSAFAYYHVSYYYSLPFGATWTFDALLITFVGGIGTLAGPLIGAAFFVLVRDFVATALTDIHLIVFGLLFIVVVLVLPGGLVELWTERQTFAKKFMGLFSTEARPAEKTPAGMGSAQDD